MKTTLITLLCVIHFNLLFAQDAKSYETEIYKSRTAQFKSEGLPQNSIVFFGNSLTQGGQWDKYFPDQHPVNRGIIGDNTEGALARLSEIIEAAPVKLFILTGVNDISQDHKNDYICKNINEIIRQVKEKSPETIIYVQSLLPINNTFGRYKRLINKEKQIEKLNKQLAKLCKKEKIKFINLYPLFLQTKHVLNPIYTTDGLHLNEAGYEIWVNRIRELVEK